MSKCPKPFYLLTVVTLNKAVLSYTDSTIKSMVMHQPSVERKLTILDDDLKNKREDDSKSEDMTRKVMTSFNVFKVFFSLQYV